MEYENQYAFPHTRTDEDLKQKKSQAFTAMNIDGVVFSFYHRLPR